MDTGMTRAFTKHVRIANRKDEIRFRLFCDAQMQSFIEYLKKLLKNGGI